MTPSDNPALPRRSRTILAHFEGPVNEQFVFMFIFAGTNAKSASLKFVNFYQIDGH